MKHFTNLVAAFVATATLTLAGCGGSSTAPVSGKVTMDGKPVEGIRLVFSPVLVDANTDPGPWSTGVTNSQGEYQLQTRHKEDGATVGQHIVTFVYDDADNVDSLRERLREAKGDGDKAEVDKIKKSIEDFKARQKERPKFSKDSKKQFEVTAGGTSDANFELAK